MEQEHCSSQDKEPASIVSRGDEVDAHAFHSDPEDSILYPEITRARVSRRGKVVAQDLDRTIEIVLSNEAQTLADIYEQSTADKI